jgi:hypothetical protein
MTEKTPQADCLLEIEFARWVSAFSREMQRRGFRGRGQVEPIINRRLSSGLIKVCG